MNQRHPFKPVIIALAFSVLSSFLIYSFYGKFKNQENSNDITKIRIVNSCDSAITVFVTLGSTPGCLQSIMAISYITDSIAPLVGSFTLSANDSTIDYAPDSTLGFNGNITFFTRPLNCPNDTFPTATNIFEFIVNNGFQSGIPQNNVDISCVAGVNCYLKAYMSGGNAWNASYLYPQVDSIYNKGISNNSGLPGVFPYGCDICTGRVNPPSCTKGDKDKQANNICNVQRNAVGSGGGLIRLVYLGSN